MKPDFTKSLLFVIFGIFYAFGGNAASSIFSNYGQIQNVQNYSSNPFWTPNSPYNSSVPRPVYVQGTDLDTKECTNVVKSLVAVQCMVRDNCKNTKLSEIRREIMVQLSELPNHNYVTACAGFIDGAYDDYVEQYGNALSTRPVAFPNGTMPTQTNNDIQIENPYKQKTPKWQNEIKERANELAALQRQNGGNNAHLTATAFPTTYADYSFSDRIENEFAGLEPYKDLKAYRELNVKTTAEWCADTEHQKTQECMDFLCSEGGADATTFECITWRCSKSEYEEANHEMCEMNKYCGKNDASNECLKYKCNLDGYKELHQCKIWLCDNDPIYESDHKNECDKIHNNGTPNNGSGNDEGSGSNASETSPHEGEYRSFKIS